MILIEVHGNCCNHVNPQECLDHFKNYAGEHLLRELLPINRSDIDVVFVLNAGLALSGGEDFLVKMFFDAGSPNEKMATVIAGCCNAAFHCGRCRNRKRTRCALYSFTESTIVVSTDEVTQPLYSKV